MCGKIDCYIQAFSNLKPPLGKAKSLLLRAVLDLIAAKKINREFIELSPDLADTYDRYWQEVMTDDPVPDIAELFLELDKEPFWHLASRPGAPEPVGEITSLEMLKEHYLGAKIDSELFKLCLMEPLLRRLREVLVETYFEGEAKDILQDFSGQLEPDMVNQYNEPGCRTSGPTGLRRR